MGAKTSISPMTVSGAVKKCDPAGTCIEIVPSANYTNTWGADVAVDSSGNIYLTDFGDCTNPEICQ